MATRKPKDDPLTVLLAMVTDERNQVIELTGKPRRTSQAIDSELSTKTVKEFDELREYQFGSMTVESGRIDPAQWRQYYNAVVAMLCRDDFLPAFDAACAARTDLEGNYLLPLRDCRSEMLNRAAAYLRSDDVSEIDSTAEPTGAVGRLLFDLERKRLATPDSQPTVIESSSGSRAIDIDAHAVALLTKHPDWTKKRIAEEIDCHPQYIYSKDLAKFQEAWEVHKNAQQGKVRRGSKDRETGVETMGDEDIDFDEIDSRNGWAEK